MSTRRNTEHTKAHDTQPVFRISNVFHQGAQVTVHLSHVSGPLTGAHMEALYRAFLRYHAVYLVIPDSRPPSKLSNRFVKAVAAVKRRGRK